MRIQDHVGNLVTGRVKPGNMFKLNNIAKQLLKEDEEGYRGLIGGFEEQEHVNDYTLLFWSNAHDLALVLNRENRSHYLVYVEMITSEYYSDDFIGSREYGWDEDGQTSTLIFHPSGGYQSLEEEGILFFTKHHTEDGDFTDSLTEFKETYKEILKITPENERMVIMAFKDFFISYSDRD